MPNSKSPFSSIDSSFLADVQGGCGRRRCHGRCGGKTVNIVNNYGGAPAAAPAATGGTAVDVNVGYQQA